MLLGLSAYNSSSSDEDQEKEKPVRQKKKISIPQAKYNSSDEDDDSPSKKKPKTGEEPKKSSSLFSKLPPPRNTIGGGKQANRTLIPHVFTKKPSSTNPAAIANVKKSKPVDQDPDSSDNEDVEFFSFVDKKSQIDVSEKTNDEATGSFLPLARIQPSLPTVTPAADAYLPASQTESVSYNSLTDSSIGSGHTNAVNELVTTGPNLSLPESVSSWHADDRFKRIQGKKNRNEKIEIIDVNADSALEGNKELLLQQISEEKNLNRMSHSKKNNNAPSATSKRKHQLSYLIHQAKEREIELKNAWAAGNQARKAARNRYGF